VADVYIQISGKISDYQKSERAYIVSRNKNQRRERGGMKSGLDS